MNGDQAQVSELARWAQAEAGEIVKIASVNQGHIGEDAADAAAEHGIKLEVVKLPAAKSGFAPSPRRWIIEPSFSWTARLRQTPCDY